MGKFQNVNFEKPVVLKVARDYNNKTIVLQLFEMWRSSNRALALKIVNCIVEATFQVILTSEYIFFYLKM
jgi:hypothetical protein